MKLMTAIVAWFARQPSVVRGSLWAVVAAGFFTGMPISVRYLSDVMTSFEIVFFRSFLGMVIMAPFLAMRGWTGLRTGAPWLHVQRSTINFIGMVMWFYALGIMPLADATAIHFTMPLFIVLLATIFLGEKIGPRRLVAIGTGFLGVLVILRPGSVEFGLPAAGVLASAALYGGSVIYVKVITRTDAVSTVTFYTHLIMMLLSLIPTMMYWRSPGWDDVPALALLAGCGTIAPYCFSRALKAMDAGLVAPFDFLRLPFTALAGLLIFAETTSFWTWVGAAVIFGSTTYITRREAVLERQNRTGADHSDS
jgi:drug/metabolite transporter (DMT)-like permease